MNKFDAEIKQETQVFHTINNVLLSLVIIGAVVVATQVGKFQIPGDIHGQSSTLLAFATFAGITLTYTLFYIFIRITLKNYEENLRQNYFNQALLVELSRLGSK